MYSENKKLIEDLKNGNESAYKHLVTSFHKPLLSYALSFTNDEASAKDIVQNVFLKTWEYRKKLKAEHSIKSFLYKTTYNEFINHYHKNRRLSTLERTYMETLDEIVLETVSNSEQFEQKIRLVGEAISKLPKKCKETFLLSKKEGLTNIEIAEYLNVSVRTVEWQLNKAYNIIRSNTSELKFLFILGLFLTLLN